MTKIDAKTQEEIVTIFQEIGASPVQANRMLNSLRGADFPLGVAMMLRIVAQEKAQVQKIRLEAERKARQKATTPTLDTERNSPGESKPYSLPKNRREFFDLRFPEICWMKSHKPDIYSLYMRR